MTAMKLILSIVAGIVVGIIGAILVIWQPKPNTLGIQTERSIEVYGFQPFWLLDSAHTPYQDYITAFNYFALQLSADGSVRRLNTPTEQEPGYTNLTSERVRTLLSQLNQQGIRTALTVQNADEESISQLLITPAQSARNMMDDITPIMREYQFDELNIDIESFAYAAPDKQEKFTLFVAEVDRIMDEEDLGILSIDILPISLVSERLTDTEALDEYIDLFILMTYDYHTSGSYIAGPVAPVGGAGSSREFDITVSIQEAMRQTSPDKILMGIPTYGYEWDTLSTEYYAASIPGTGKIVTHKQVQKTIEDCNRSCVIRRDEDTLQPYLTIPEEGGYYRQLYYEDAESIRYKARMAERYGLRGIAIWALGYEPMSVTETFESFVSDE
ncbi:MAG: glycosyl hydrolase family 18 protein [Patescibacteria group bacterium]